MIQALRVTFRNASRRRASSFVLGILPRQAGALGGACCGRHDAWAKADADARGPSFLTS